ncbi:MAG: hypothetical protein MZV65_40880 [Chromatiales bacterium]|nr:hypothetical protein [Chromatiales bacterium]
MVRPMPLQARPLRRWQLDGALGEKLLGGLVVLGLQGQRAHGDQAAEIVRVGLERLLGGGACRLDLQRAEIEQRRHAERLGMVGVSGGEFVQQLDGVIEAHRGGAGSVPAALAPRESGYRPRPAGRASRASANRRASARA